MPTIFYSWQSDAPNNINRGFIRAALDRAVKELAAHPNVEDRPDVQQDTAGVAGAPDIANTIYERIRRANIFVADVSIVVTGDTPRGTQRRTPNPNVMIELGYAFHALGEANVVLVMNRALGAVEELPFDLRGRRPVQYELPPDATDKASVRKLLAKDLAANLRIMLSALPPAEAGDGVTAAIDAIESGANNRKARCRAAVEELTRRLDEVNVPRDTRPDDPSVIDAMRRSFTATERFAALARVLAEHGDTTALPGIIKGLEAVLARQRTPRGYSGRTPLGQFPLFYFVAVNWALTLVAEMVRAEAYPLFRHLAAARVYVENPSHGSPGEVPLLEYLIGPESLYSKDARFPKSFCPLGDLLREELAARPDGPSLDEFVDADVLLALAARLRGGLWIPATIFRLNFHDIPRVVRLLNSETRGPGLATVCGYQTAESARAALLEIAAHVDQIVADNDGMALFRRDWSRLGG